MRLLNSLSSLDCNNLRYSYKPIFGNIGIHVDMRHSFIDRLQPSF